MFTRNGTSELDGFKLGLAHFGTSVDGHPIQVTYDDDQGLPAVSLSDARQLVTSVHVQAIEGPLVAAVPPWGTLSPAEWTPLLPRPASARQASEFTGRAAPCS